MDAGILEDVLRHIHNWFVHDSYYGTWTITGGIIQSNPGISDGQYFRIRGSVFNDGLHKWPTRLLVDETFEGSIDALAVPKAIVTIAFEISDWIDKNNAAKNAALESPYKSESFDGYSYSLKDDLTAQNASGGLTGWQAEFASRLNEWRKI